MKFILICWFAVIMPMLYSPGDGAIKNGSKNKPSNTLNRITGGDEDLAAFKETKILISEFADIVKDYRTGLTSPKVEMMMRKNQMRRVTVD